MSESMWVEIEIPEGCVDAGAIIVTRFIDENGDMRFQAEFPEGASFSELLGTLEMAKHKLMAEIERDWAEDDDDS